MSVLVPIDGSKNAENGVPWAARLARLLDTDVGFVHVVDHEAVAGSEALADAQRRFRAYASELAGRWDISRHHAAVLHGHHAASIVAAGATAHYIVIASHGRGGFRAAFVGSVADKVVRGSTVPVLLVPALGAPVEPDERTILVALDGSDIAERGLDVARDLAARMHTTVTLFRAWMVPMQPTDSFEPYSFPDLWADLEVEAKEYLKAKVGPGEERVVTMGHAASAIADLAATIDPELVVVTSSGKGLAARIALGSTTERLAHSLHRPLLVVPTSPTV